VKKAWCCVCGEKWIAQRQRERRERAHMGSVFTALQQEDEEMIVRSMDELLQHCMTGEE
jgi:hypothetical protein